MSLLPSPVLNCSSTAQEPCDKHCPGAPVQEQSPSVQLAHHRHLLDGSMDFTSFVLQFSNLLWLKLLVANRRGTNYRRRFVSMELALETLAPSPCRTSGPGGEVHGPPQVQTDRSSAGCGREWTETVRGMQDFPGSAGRFWKPCPEAAAPTSPRACGLSEPAYLCLRARRCEGTEWAGGWGCLPTTAGIESPMNFFMERGQLAPQ